MLVAAQVWLERTRSRWLAGTVLAVFFVPVFFVVVRSLFKGSARQQEMNRRHAEEAGVGTHD